MTPRGILDAILYYFFHLIYLGYPADILSRLWLAHDIAIEVGSVHQAWKMFDDSTRESYKTIGTLAALLAGVMTGLSTIGIYREDDTIRTLLLSGITASIISASSCLSMLSTMYFDPVNIEHHWRSLGFVFVIVLSGPAAWLNIAFWIFQLSILAIVWSTDSTPARGIVTLFIVMRVLFNVAHQLCVITPGDSMLVNILLGRRQGMSHHMVNLNKDTIKRRGEYLHTLQMVIRRNSDDSSNPAENEDAPIPLSVVIERGDIGRGSLEEPELDL